jgi:hypothetical protein
MIETVRVPSLKTPYRLVYSLEGKFYWIWPEVDDLIRGSFSSFDEAEQEASNTDLCEVTA